MKETIFTIIIIILLVVIVVVTSKPDTRTTQEVLQERYVRCIKNADDINVSACKAILN